MRAQKPQPQTCSDSGIHPLDSNPVQLTLSSVIEGVAKRRSLRPWSGRNPESYVMMKGFAEVNLPSSPPLSPSSSSLTTLGLQKDQAKTARACTSPASAPPLAVKEGNSSVSITSTASFSREASPSPTQRSTKQTGRSYNSRISSSSTAQERVLKDTKTKFLPRPKVLGGGPKPVVAQCKTTDQQSVPVAKRARAWGGPPKPASTSDQPLDIDELRRKARTSKFAPQESLSRIPILPTFSDFRPPFFGL